MIHWILNSLDTPPSSCRHVQLPAPAAGRLQPVALHTGWRHAAGQLGLTQLTTVAGAGHAQNNFQGVLSLPYPAFVPHGI